MQAVQAHSHEGGQENEGSFHKVVTRCLWIDCAIKGAPCRRIGIEERSHSVRANQNTSKRRPWPGGRWCALKSVGVPWNPGETDLETTPASDGWEHVARSEERRVGKECRSRWS